MANSPDHFKCNETWYVQLEGLAMKHFSPYFSKFLAEAVRNCTLKEYSHLKHLCAKKILMEYVPSAKKWQVRVKKCGM